MNAKNTLKRTKKITFLGQTSIVLSVKHQIALFFQKILLFDRTVQNKILGYFFTYFITSKKLRNHKVFTKFIVVNIYAVSCGHWEGHGDRQRLSNRFHVCCLLYNVFGSTTGLCTCFDTLLKAVDLKLIQNKWAVYATTKHSVSSS